MVEMQIRGQTIRFDRGATAAVYETVARGDAEQCGCISCENFAAQRDVVYPDSFRALLTQLGIDANKEGEAFDYGAIEDGRHLYGGWFYLVGEIVTDGERNFKSRDSHHAAPASHYFDFFFTTSHPDAEAFRGGPILAIEFTTHAKWVLPEGLYCGTAPEDLPL